MARLPAEDYLQNFRFHVLEVEGGAAALEAPTAGFNTVTTPTITVEQTEHRVGNEIWAKKLRGIATVEDATFSRGIALADRAFFDWVMTKVFGQQPYRSDIDVMQYNQEQDGTQETHAPSRKLTLKEAFPTSVKPMGDLDASASDVSLQEITITLERMELEAPTATTLGMQLPG